MVRRRKEEDGKLRAELAVLKEILQTTDVKLERILLHVECEIKKRGLLKILPKTSDLLVSRVQSGNATYVVMRVPGAQPRKLSARQREIAPLVVEGLPRTAIARRLGISARTVDNHVERLYVKYGVDCRTAFVRRITSLGLGLAADPACVGKDN